MATYFTGKGYGVSTLTDVSGRPLLTYQGPNDKTPILLSDRVAVVKDPTIVQVWTLAELYNTRMAQATSAAIKKAVGGTSAQELDHKIPLELGGSNSIANLQLTTNIAGTSNNTDDPYENSLSAQVQAGQISLQAAWEAMATRKGFQLGEISPIGVQITFTTVLQTILTALTSSGGGAGGKVLKTDTTIIDAQLKQNAAAAVANPLNLNARVAFFQSQIAASVAKTGMTNDEAIANILATARAYAAAQGNNPADVSTNVGVTAGQLSTASTAVSFEQSPLVSGMLKIAVYVLDSAPFVAVAALIGIILVAAFAGPEALAALTGIPFLSSVITALGISTTAGVVAGVALYIEFIIAWGFLFDMTVKQYGDTSVINASLLQTSYKDAGISAISAAAAPLPPQQYSSNATAAASAAGTNIETAQQPTEDAFAAYLAAQNIPTPDLTAAKIAQLRTQFDAQQAAAIESAPAPTATAPTAPFGAPAGNVLVTAVTSGVVGNASAFTPRPLDIIESVGDLTTDAQNNLSAFLTALPGFLGYEITLASSVIADDGSHVFGATNRVISKYSAKGVPEYKNVTNKFAVLTVYYVPSPRKRVVLDKITLGPIDETTYTPSKGDLADIIAHLQENFVIAVPGTETQSVAPSIMPSIAPPAQTQQIQTDTTNTQQAPTPPTLVQGAPSACAATSLADFYSAQGLSLPSIQARSALYEQAGLGTAATYTGSATQNTKLLQSLLQTLGCFVQAPATTPPPQSTAVAGNLSPAASIPTVPTSDQLAARLNPTAFTVPIPQEGQIFRAVGDTVGTQLYQVQNEFIISIAQNGKVPNTDLRLPDGTIAPAGILYTGSQNLNNATVIDPNFRGNWWTNVTAQQNYDAQNGAGAFAALPSYNMADLQTVLNANYGRLPAASTQTFN